MVWWLVGLWLASPALLPILWLLGKSLPCGSGRLGGRTVPSSLPWRIGCAADEEKRKSLPSFPRRHDPPGFSEA